MSGYNGPRWSGLGANISPTVAKVFMAGMPRHHLEKLLLRTNAPATVRAEALDAWDSMRAAAILYDERALGISPPAFAVETVEGLSDGPARLMSADAAGKRLGLSGRRVRGLVGKGLLLGEMQGNKWMVDRAAVEAMALSRATSTGPLPGAGEREAA